MKVSLVKKRRGIERIECLKKFNLCKIFVLVGMRLFQIASFEYSNVQ